MKKKAILCSLAHLRSCFVLLVELRMTTTTQPQIILHQGNLQTLYLQKFVRFQKDSSTVGCLLC